MRAPRAPAALTWLALGLFLAGFLAFELAPNSADAALGTRAGMNVWFWFVAAQLFINIHHYFIDNAVAVPPARRDRAPPPLNPHGSIRLFNVRAPV